MLREKCFLTHGLRTLSSSRLGLMHRACCALCCDFDLHMAQIGNSGEAGTHETARFPNHIRPY